MAEQMVIWPTYAAGSQACLEALARQALAVGGRRALAAWRGGGAAAPCLRVAHVHGERHQLWWEFSLEASFRWQAHLWQLRPAVYRWRLRRLTRALGLEGLLGREVSALTHEARALADLAVALLPGPDLLLWEEPFYLLGEAGATRAIRLVRELHAEGMALVAVASESPGLGDLADAQALPLRPLLHLAR